MVKEVYFSMNNIFFSKYENIKEVGDIYIKNFGDYRTECRKTIFDFQDKIIKVLGFSRLSFRLRSKENDNDITDMEKIVDPFDAMDINLDNFCCYFSCIFNITNCYIQWNFEIRRKSQVLYIESINTKKEYRVSALDILIGDIGNYLYDYFKERNNKLMG